MSNLQENRNSIDPFGRIGGKKQQNLLDEERKQHFEKTIHKEIPLFVKVHMAWMLMLERQGIVETQRAVKILKALLEIDETSVQEMLKNWKPSAWEPMVLLEQYLTSKIGQIATDLNIGRTIPPPFYRMELLPLLLRILDESISLLECLLKHADIHKKTVMPGYTHLQHAQPMTYGHYLLGLYDPLYRAVVQLEHAYTSTNKFELGCGALSGTSFQVDRRFPAELLAFDGIVEHSNDAVSATDFLIDILSSLTNIFIPLSRVSNDLDIWSSFEFSMVEIDDEISNPSSMMPQKKNPAVFEFCRRTIASILGAYSEVVCGSHATQYGDVTEMRELAFAIHPKLEESAKQIALFHQAVDTMIIKNERMLELAKAGFSTATELAAVLYREASIPLRMAHGIVAEIVRQQLSEGRQLDMITPELVSSISEKITGSPIFLSREVLLASVDPIAFVNAHTSEGGVSSVVTSAMIEARKNEIVQLKERQHIRTQKRVYADNQLFEHVKKLVNG